jgi:hypothetical protein
VRSAAWLVGIAAILPTAAIAAEAPPAAATFAPPSTPMLLTRTLRQVLGDGKEVRTRRSYRITFVREETGFRIDGTLAEVAVEAPAGLEALAELERRRPDAGLFPMHLDAQGMIRTKPEPPASAVERQAIELAAAQVGGMKLPAAEKTEARGFIAQFRTRPSRTPWPQDLFHPVPGRRREQRLIPLPNGLRGEVSTDIDASADSSGLVSAFTRKVTTDLDGDKRVVFEDWRLGPVP